LEIDLDTKYFSCGGIRTAVVSIYMAQCLLISKVILAFGYLFNSLELTLHRINNKMTSPKDTTKGHKVDIVLDTFSKDQLRQLLEDDEYNEEALEFSDDGNDSVNDLMNRDDAAFKDVFGGTAVDKDFEQEEEDDEESDFSDYEDSAESKRKRYETLADLGFDQEEDEDEMISDNDSDDEFTFKNALREARNFKIKPSKKKRGGLAAIRRRIRRTELDPEVKLLLSQANEAFVNLDLDNALKLYTKVIKMDKNNFSAYKTLGEIYRMKDELNKCSNIWLLAAHLNPKDVDFWKTVAELSVELGHFKQAIYCYRRAISSSGGKDYDAIFSRACLYREVGKYKRASFGLLKLRSLLPSDPRIVRELAKVYVEESRVNDAISMYTKILDDNVKFRKLIDKGENVKLDNINFDWSELNILSELYASKAAWPLGIKALRQISRWIQERENQIFWDDNMNNDIEFDERKYDHPRFQKLKSHENSLDYSLPIDIRVQLGIFRLNNKNEDEALKHFSILLDQPLEETPDLFFKVGMELESFALFREALEFLIPLSYYEEYNTSELVATIAKCLRETEDFENAKDTYIRLLEYDNENVELKIALAECYFYLDDIDSANRLYNEAREHRIKEKTLTKENDLETELLVEDDEEGNELVNEMDIDKEQGTQAIIDDGPIKKRKKKKAVYTDDELRTMSIKSEIRVKKLYDRCTKLLSQIDFLHQKKEDLTPEESISLKTMANIWIEMVSDLIEIFSMYRWFFAADKSKRFSTTLRLRTSKLGIDQKILRMKYLQNEIILSQHYLSANYPEGVFKGLDYSQWYDLFVKYAMLIAEFEQDAENAIVIQDIIKHIIVFKGKELATMLVGLSIGVLTKNTQIVMTQTRNLMNEYQFSIDSFRLYLASLIPYHEMELTFADPPSQKFMLRQVKAFDSLTDDKRENVTGRATITKTNVDTSKQHFLINYIYGSYLFTNKSYYSALIYLLKLYHTYPNNPDLLFLLALTNLHRSIQRKTLNTSFQILQGFTFLLEYIKTKDQNDPYNKMEAYYNIGRSFNFLGLDHLAIGFYERVLEIEVDDSKYDLKMEAAHNLYTIYNINRNYKQAEDIMNKYLVV
jgi:general transcription factor 3C polypeptide 3 (transcription factor C subunit 4)